MNYKEDLTTIWGSCPQRTTEEPERIKNYQRYTKDVLIEWLIQTEDLKDYYKAEFYKLKEYER